MTGSIRVRGLECTVFAQRVLRWCDPGLPRVPAFHVGDGYNKARTHPVRCVVWHWTGGENEPPVMAEVLRKRQLGVEFAISREGTIYQFCDPAEVDTADAGILNSRSVGVEMVCYGYAAQLGALGRVLKVPVVPSRGQDRETYDDTVHGRRLRMAKFYPAQMTAAFALADTLSMAFGIPRQVPPLDNQAIPGIREFDGHIGHYQITNRKIDPGPWFMRELRAHFT